MKESERNEEDYLSGGVCPAPFPVATKAGRDEGTGGRDDTPWISTSPHNSARSSN